MCIQDAKDLETRTVIKAKKEELKGKKVFVVEGYRDNELKDKEVIIITNGMRMDNHLLSLCHDLRMLIIGDGCNTELMQGLVFDSMPNLERVEIGKNCFSKVTSFHVQHCPKLRRVFIGDGSFTICTECVIEDNEDLLELQFGSTAADDEENEDGEEENEDDAREDVVEPPNEDDENEEGEEDPTCFQCSTLTLSSGFSPVERNE